MQLKRLAYDLIQRFVAIGLLNAVHGCAHRGSDGKQPHDLGSILRRNLLPHEQQKAYLSVTLSGRSFFSFLVAVVRTKDGSIAVIQQPINLLAVSAIAS